MEAKNLLDYLMLIPDPRVDRTRRHELTDIVFIGLAAVLCGAEGWTQVEEFGKVSHDWLASFLKLPNGIPSHDTFGRVFGALDPDALEAALQAFVRDLAGESAGTHVAIDGKTLRRSFDRAAEQAAIHMVSAWACENGVCFGQVKVDDKSNEITAIPQLLSRLNLEGSVVTIDAMGCQKTIARQIVDGGGDYVLALKGNQGTLHEEVREFFEDVAQGRLTADVERSHRIEKDHGRIEERTLWVSRDVDWLRDADQWAGLSGIVAVESARTVEGNTTRECRYYICSGAFSAEELGALIRRHWSIENELHWVLDVAFDEDQCRVRIQNAAENLSRLRAFALSLLKQDTKAKVGIQGRRLKAAWDKSYLLRILGF
jgi:predicted transposase YbfD/YdcC